MYNIIHKIYNIIIPEYYITGQSDNFSIGFYIYSFKFINIFLFYISAIKFLKSTGKENS